MAWVRTGTSMIGFGFTIYKFFQFETSSNATVRKGLLSPRHFALIMVSIGLLSLLMATLQHRQQVRELKKYLNPPSHSLAEIVAGLVSGFGLLVLMATVFRL